MMPCKLCGAPAVYTHYFIPECESCLEKSRKLFSGRRLFYEAVPGVLARRGTVIIE
jgi:hypothetical protein